MDTQKIEHNSGLREDNILVDASLSDVDAQSDVSPKDSKIAEKSKKNVFADRGKVVDNTIKTPLSLQKSYRFIQPLGHGSQAKLFLAIRLSDKQKVTIKQLDIGSVKTWKEYELFQREAKVLESINLPGVAHFYEAIDCLEDDPPCSYIVQEFIEGASIAQMLKSGHRFKIHDVYDILIQLLQILSKLHSMTPPVIHRDIKPSNIMITPTKKEGYRVTLIDFGAVANPQVQSGGSTVAGTFGYMPPEQLMGKPVPASDIYALGAVAVELFSGKSPANLPSKDFRLIFEPEMELYSPALHTTLRKMLEPNVEARLSDTEDLIKTFSQFQNENYVLQTVDDHQIDKTRAYNERLQAVESIGDNGNMDIWQQLPDVTPRNIPQQIVDYLGICTDTAEIGKFWKNENVSVDKNRSDAGCLFVFGVIGAITGLILFGPKLTGLTLDRGGASELIGLISFVSFGLFVMIAFFIKSGFNKIKEEQNANDTQAQMNSEPGQTPDEQQSIGKKSKVDIQSIYQLIENGRKTVATIVSITYMPLPSNKVMRRVSGPDRSDLFICMDVPSFVVRYKFNPPDDARKSDLVHEFTAHTDPETHYQVGDPLPILYQIERDFFKETVSSMPFPFPLCDTTSDQIYDESSVPKKKINVNMDAFLPRLNTNCTDYHQYIKYMIEAIDSDDQRQLMKEIENAWHIEEPTCLTFFLELSKQLLDSTQSLEFSSVWCHEVVISTLVKSMGCSSEKTRQVVDEFLVWYFEYKHPTTEDIEAIFNSEFTLFSTELTNAVVELYFKENASNDIKNICRKKIKIPLEQMSTFFKNEKYAELIPAMFAGWNGFLSDHNVQKKYLECVKEYFTSTHYSDKMNCAVFDAIWQGLDKLSVIPKPFIKFFTTLFAQSEGKLTFHIRDKLSKLPKNRMRH